MNSPPISRPRVVALIVAAGSGTRAGSAVPKQFALVAGKPMIAHSHAAFAGHAAVDSVVVVVGAGQADALRSVIDDVRHIDGGATRRDSVRAGLEAIAADEMIRIRVAPTWLRVDARYGSVYRRRGQPGLVLR